MGVKLCMPYWIRGVFCPRQHVHNSHLMPVYLAESITTAYNRGVSGVSGVCHYARTETSFECIHLQNN